MKKYLYSAVTVVIVLVIVFIALNKDSRTPNNIINDYKNATYVIDGQSITLKNGYAETTIVPGSASKTITRYFGNDLITDLNEDGIDDVVFLITQSGGGTGTFYYVVGAISAQYAGCAPNQKDCGGVDYVGTDAYYLGDRIAPQTINISQNPRHENVIVVNYADRKKDEPMTVQPSVGKSVYLKIDKNNRWAIVANDFEGEGI